MGKDDGRAGPSRSPRKSLPSSPLSPTAAGSAHPTGYGIIAKSVSLFDLVGEAQEEEEAAVGMPPPSPPDFRTTDDRPAGQPSCVALSVEAPLAHNVRQAWTFLCTHHAAFTDHPSHSRHDVDEAEPSGFAEPNRDECFPPPTSPNRSPFSASSDPAASPPRPHRCPATTSSNDPLRPVVDEAVRVAVGYETSIIHAFPHRPPALVLLEAIDPVGLHEGLSATPVSSLGAASPAEEAEEEGRLASSASWTTGGGPFAGGGCSVVVYRQHLAPHPTLLVYFAEQHEACVPLRLTRVVEDGRMALVEAYPIWEEAATAPRGGVSHNVGSAFPTSRMAPPPCAVGGWYTPALSASSFPSDGAAVPTWGGQERSHRLLSNGRTTPSSSPPTPGTPLLLPIRWWKEKKSGGRPSRDCSSHGTMGHGTTAASTSLYAASFLEEREAYALHLHHRAVMASVPDPFCVVRVLPPQTIFLFRYRLVPG